nr:MAG TPA: hypothetical protein [Caudoviricetes sp.]
MNSILDVAKWFLAKEKMTHKKLQKLCYYAQAWSYAIQPEPLTNAVFEAWVHGPVCREIYEQYRDYGFDYIPQVENPPVFSPDEEDFLGSVWLTYGENTANALEALTHTELPWQTARAGLRPDEPSNRPIDPAVMRTFYRSIYIGGDA